MSRESVKWTPMQSAAINTQHKTLLVSAAAGSGKTAVLTERIIKRLCDKENPGDISRMLIVTFTKAAANELKTRISRAISEAIASNGTNRHLSRQLLLLGSAKICTIHSFCLDVIKKNLKLLSLPEGISVGSDPEIKLIAKQTMSEVINDAYAGKFLPGYEAECFDKLSDLFSSAASDEGMLQSLLEIYNRKLASYPEGVDFLKMCADDMQVQAHLPFLETSYGRIIIKEAISGLEQLSHEYNTLINELSGDQTAYEKYIPCISSELSFITAFSDELSRGQNENARSRLNAFEVTRLPSLPKGYDSVYKEPYKALRGELKDCLKNTFIPLLFADEEKIRETTHLSCSLILDLYRVLSCFDIHFREEKKRLCRLDYTDIERYAFKLLVDDGRPSELARELSRSFDEIYIDEYQDTNLLQDMIFSAISNPDNRFMVGDIKQSIYGFRGAAPENFSHYRDSFECYEQNKSIKSESATIFLSNNFRCDSTVIDFCNTVFRTLFKNSSGNVPYYDSDDLVCSKNDGDLSTVPVNIVLASNSENDEGIITEAEYIASEIKRLITCEKKKDGTPISPSDIAVLVRTNAASLPIEKAINSLGIMTTNNIATEFFENSEILLMMSLLNTIDNPMRDVYLAGVLKSPLFSFTLDELVKIRASKLKGTLYEALVEYTAANDFEKGSYFLDKLEYFRTLSCGNQVDKLIHKLYSECSLFAIVSANAKPGTTPREARENLMLLYKYARDFEASSFKGLSSFINYVDDIIAEKTTLPGSSSKAPSGDNVHIMTIHHSKGLEFPVVFVAGTQKKVSMNDLSSPVLIDRRAGISTDLPGLVPGTRVKSFYRLALECTIRESCFEEEMRVLYVAYTRARERLYITAAYKNPRAEYEKAQAASKNVSKSVIMKSVPYIQWTLIAVLASNYLSEQKCKLTIPTEVISDAAVFAKADLPVNNNICDDGIISRIKENLAFRYPYADAVSIPAKLSVSELFKGVLDIDSVELFAEKFSGDLLSRMNDTSPRFIEECTQTITAAQCGTATHEFMQFCDFDLAEKFGIHKEIERLVALGYITSESAAIINADQAADFFNSRLYLDRIKGARQLWREHRFNVGLPASEFTLSSDRISALSDDTLFVQGIIDCFIENEDGSFTLIDYKTDHIPHELERNTEKFEKILAQRHSGQLTYYKRALEIITKKPVSEVLIYSFATGNAIDITDLCR